MTIFSATSDADISRCFPVMQELRPHLVADRFVAQVRRMQAEGYHLAALEVEAGICGVAGYRYYEKLFSGRNLYVDDLVTADRHRSSGYGAALLAWLCAQAKAHGCDQLELDSGVQRRDAHRFYFREHMHIAAYHFTVGLRP